jgi:hypothetical protein
VQPIVDRSFYEDNQLGDDEISERKIVRRTWAARDTVKEQERQRRIRSFRFTAGTL